MRVFFFSRYAIRKPRKSDGSLNLIRAKATRADIHRFMRAIDDNLHLADIGLPGSVGLAVGVRNVQTKLKTLSTEFTLCHVFDTSR